MDQKSCLGAILSGGQSVRMGRDKALLKLGGEWLITRVVRRLQNQLDSIIINSANHTPPLMETGLPLVADLPEFAENGPLAGIFSAMDYAQSANHQTTDYQAIITVAVDTPFFPANYARQLIVKSAVNEGKPVIAATEAAWHPTFGLWPLSLKDALEQHLRTAQEKSILAFATRHDVQIVLFTPAPHCSIDPFFNMNTPDDLARAKALVAKIEEKQL